MKMITRLSYFPTALLALTLSLTTTFAQSSDTKKSNTKPADVAGTWTWSVPSRQEGNPPRESSIELKQDGSNISGVYKTARGESPISEGKVTGNNISFKISRTTDRGTFVTQYAGVVEGGQIKGNVKSQFGDRTFDREWTAQRKVNLAGDWNWSMKRDNGEVWTATLTLKTGENNQISGNFKSPNGELPIRNAMLKGNEFTFETLWERDGNSITIKNNATVNGSMMKGTSSGSRDGETWTREWSAEKAK